MTAIGWFENKLPLRTHVAETLLLNKLYNSYVVNFLVVILTKIAAVPKAKPYNEKEPI